MIHHQSFNAWKPEEKVLTQKKNDVRQQCVWCDRVINVKVSGTDVETHVAAAYIW